MRCFVAPHLNAVPLPHAQSPIKTSGEDAVAVCLNGDDGARVAGQRAHASAAGAVTGYVPDA